MAVLLLLIIFILICILAYKSAIFLFSPLNKVGTIAISSVTDEPLSPSEYVKQEAKVLGIGFGNEQTVIMKEPKFDGNKVIAYEGEPIKQFEFRPQTWEQFISQTDAKEQAKIIMEKARRGIRCHCILSAIRGHGKTTFIELLAKSLNAHLIQRVGKQVDEDELANIINEINRSEAPYVIFFLDEIDTTDWKVIKILNPLIEQFKINGKQIRPFIFCSATINKDVLIKNNPDTLDRIPHHIQFTRYSIDDIAIIINQYKNQLYPNEEVSQEVIKKIASESKYNPRTSISLLEDYIIVKDINKVIKTRRIIKDGLDDIDIKILKALANSKKAIGANCLAMKTGLTQNQYLREYEPFLVEFNYIERVPSRIISEKGKEFLKGVDNDIRKI
jgi:Holliday junction resolvasome RuvABC ATP-dependent DNA helicase subunit